MGEKASGSEGWLGRVQRVGEAFDGAGTPWSRALGPMLRPVLRPLGWGVSIVVSGVVTVGVAQMLAVLLGYG